MNQKIAGKILYWLVVASLLTPFLFWKEMYLPFAAPKTLFFQAVIELALPFYLYLTIVYKHLRPNLKNPVTVSVLAFLGSWVVASIAGKDVFLSFAGNFARMDGVLNFAHLVLLYFYLLLLKKLEPNLVTHLLKMSVGVAVAIAGYGVWSSLGYPKLFVDLYLPLRVSSFLGNPIFYASFLIIPVFFALILAFREKEKHLRMLYLALGLLLLLGIYVSATRSVLLGFAVGLLVSVVVYFYFSAKRLKYLLAFGAVSMVVAGTVLVIFSSKLAPDSLVGRIFTANDRDSQARLIQWKAAWNGFVHHPVLGTGVETYYLTANKYFDPAIYRFDTGFWDKPHNYFLEIMVTTGFLGIISYLAVIFFSIWTWFRNFRLHHITLADFSLFLGALLAYLVQNFFGFDTISAAIMFFVLVALASMLAEPHAEIAQAAPGKLKSNLYFASFALAAVVLVIVENVFPGILLYDFNQASVAVAENHLARAFAYFEKAKKLPFDFDPSALATVAQGYAVKAADNVASNASSSQALDYAISTWRKLANASKNNPIFWLNLGTSELLQQNYFGRDNQQGILAAANAARDLVSNRIEPYFLLLQEHLYDNNLAQASDDFSHMLAYIPDDPQSDWHAKNMTQTERVVQNLAKKYDSQGNFGQAIEIYQKGMKVDAQSVLLYAGLATSYYKSGHKDLARQTAEKILQFSPESEFQVQAFIKTLN